MKTSLDPILLLGNNLHRVLLIFMSHVKTERVNIGKDFQQCQVPSRFF